jgi:ribosomal protein S18 acetylase RimI-like enzyme
MSSTLLIRAAAAEDAPAIWTILEPTIRAGETYALPREMSEADALAYWMGEGREAFVAEEREAEGDGEGEGEFEGEGRCRGSSGPRIVGTYVMRPNQAGGGAHVVNCGYMTAAAASGRGVARRMCEHSLAHARARGYRAMQFNCVVSSNERAVRLWQSLGFQILARLPLAFLHPTRGYVDALVMYQSLLPVEPI